MKKNKLFLLPLVISSLGMATLTGCALFGGNNEGDVQASETNKQFGLFGHSGKYLPEYAVAQITLNEAKTLINLGPISEKTNKRAKMDLNEQDETVKKILNKYASLTVNVNYYVEGMEEKQVRKDFYQGTDFLSILSTNNYSPFAQMNVRFLFVDDGLLDGLEMENAAFHEDLTNLVSPFDNPYTYHKDSRDELIVQTHHFAELPSSQNGGIGATFRQDCEIKFDSEGKILLWESSLGLYTSTPTGTSLEGYIFEASFEWTSK